MVLQQVNESDEEEYHSPLTGDEVGKSEDNVDLAAMESPLHPLPSMQGAFEESIVESVEQDATSEETTYGTAETRRHKLLETKQYDDSWTTRWKQRPGAKHHPLLKLFAQIVFGMHLLQQKAAKSNEEVVKILQTHVNEVDSFLERTSEDFDLAIADIAERITHLELPMAHTKVFKIMLEDTEFRTQLLDGNDKIERLIERTAEAMNAALLDVQEGEEATKELGRYLGQVKSDWPRETRDLADVFEAMRGNEQGWMKYLKDLQGKSTKLGNHLVHLRTVVRDISKLIATSNRRHSPASRTESTSRSAPNSPGLRSKFNREMVPDTPGSRSPPSTNLNKPLPREPDVGSREVTPLLSKPHPVPFAQRYESPRQHPQPPTPPLSQKSVSQTGQRTDKIPTTTPSRSMTASSSNAEKMGPSSELSNVSRHFNPLRSNPPDTVSEAGREALYARKPSRSASQSAAPNLNIFSGVQSKGLVGPPKSQATMVLLNGPHRKPSLQESMRPTSSGDKAMSTRSAPSARKNSVTSTGFTRRLSKRIKHMTPTGDRPQDGAQDDKLNSRALPPADSAYSSVTSNSPVIPKKTETADGQTGARLPPTRHGLFPHTSTTLTPAATSTQSPGATINSPEEPRSFGPPSRSATLTSKTRSVGIRKLFHRKQKSEQVAI